MCREEAGPAPVHSAEGAGPDPWRFSGARLEVWPGRKQVAHAHSARGARSKPEAGANLGQDRPKKGSLLGREP